MAYDVRVQMKSGTYYNIIEEGGNIHVWKPGWVGADGLGESYRTFDDALEAAEDDADSGIADWHVRSGAFDQASSRRLSAL